MGQFTVPLMLLTAGASAQASRVSAGAQEVELEQQKRRESAGARDREIQRKERTRAIIGAQAAEAAAKGIQMTGSVANISITDAKRAGTESLIDEVNTQSNISALSRRKRSIRRVGNINAATTILRAGTRIAERG